MAECHVLKRYKDCVADSAAEFVEAFVIAVVLADGEKVVAQSGEVVAYGGPALFIPHVALADLHISDHVLFSGIINVQQSIHRCVFEPVVPVIDNQVGSSSSRQIGEAWRS